MLSRYEDEIMSAVFSLCDGTGGCLVSPIEILSILPVKRKYTPEKVDGILYDLMCDGYFDLITSERKGEKMYVINLKEPRCLQRYKLDAPLLAAGLLT